MAHCHGSFYARRLICFPIREEVVIVSAIVIILLFLLGLVLIIKGGDYFVDAASWIAEASGVPKFLIGATIVSLGTTMPELLVSLMASAEGSIGIAVGNAVGSVTANVGLIMGISLVCIAAEVNRREQGFNFVMMVAAIGLLLAFSLSGGLSIPEALILLAMFLAYMVQSVLSARKAIKSDSSEDKPGTDRRTVVTNIIKFVAGVAGIVIGARLMVDYGTALARLLRVPESIIGATLVAIGTSLPELVTTSTALVKKQASLSIGNIVGSNIIDLTLILPLCSVVSGKALPILRQNILLDMPFCLGLVLIAVVPTLISGRFRKAQGVVMLGVYAAYIGLLCAGVV